MISKLQNTRTILATWNSILRYLMRRTALSRKWMFVLMCCASAMSFAQGAHRIGQVIVKGNNIAANVAPFAKIKVCATGTNCASVVTVYSDLALNHVLSQPVVADLSGNYSYYITPSCVDEQITAPGSPSIFLPNVCPSVGAIGSGTVTSVSVAVANGFQGTVANPTTVPALSISTDGSHYLPTTTDENNWNSKQTGLGFTPENTANKDQPSGYAGLTSGTLLQTAEFPAFTGDATSTAGTTALTLASVNSDSGSCGDTTHVCQITTNAKGLTTAQTPLAIAAVTNVSSGNLTPLFTVNVTNPSTLPTFTFTQSLSPQNSVFAGPASGGAAVPSFQTSPTFSAANLTNFPQASTSVFGVFKPDGTTITCTSGVCSAVGGGGGSVASVFGRTGTIVATSGDYSVSQVTGAAPLASPTFTGTPAVPTASPGTNTTQAASTAFVTAAVAAASTILSGTTAAITGTSLSASCDSGTVTVTGANVGSPVSASAIDGVDVGAAFLLRASVTSANTITVYICGTGTPATKAYNVAVLQ